MARQGSKLIGSGITAESVTFIELDPNDSGDAKAFREWHASFHETLGQPWAFHSHVIAGARVRWREIQSELAPLGRNSKEWNAHFRERDTEAWYVREIDAFATIVELAVVGGRPWEAVARAMQIGELLAESRLKQWDTDAVWGRDRRSELVKGAQNRRRQSPEERIALVNAYREKGHSISRACGLAARELGVHQNTVRRDYYRNKLSKPVE